MDDDQNVDIVNENCTEAVQFGFLTLDDILKVYFIVLEKMILVIGTKQLQ